MTRWTRTWILPQTPDVLGMLGRQAEVTLKGMSAFTAWASGDPAKADEVRDLEHNADSARRELLRSMQVAFTTPVPREDLFEISIQLDDVINGAKNLVREADLLAVSPDQHVQDMAAYLQVGVERLVDACRHVGTDLDSATHAADEAVKSQRRLERSYRSAMSDLLGQNHLADVVARQEMYRRLTHISDSIVHVAERIWYVSVKEA
jgi:uncharacterized protein Yka (UPF0111/DUF47 family)